MKDSKLIRDAIAFAARKHQGQVRKDGATPYFCHPMRVAMMLSNAYGVQDDDVLAAAILHDTIEDTTTDYDELRQYFYRMAVGDWVRLLSKDKRLPHQKREEEYLKTLRTAPDEVKMIKLADILDNLQDAADLSDGQGSQLERTMGKAKEYLECFKETKNPALLKMLAEVERVVNDYYSGGKVFAALVVDEVKEEYAIYLVNPTKVNYRWVLGYTGAFCGADDDLVETSKVLKEYGELKAGSAVCLERGDDFTEFDFVIWYYIDLYENSGEEPDELLAFHVPKSAYLFYEKESTVLPIINTTGVKIDVDGRFDPSGDGPSIKAIQAGQGS